MAKRRLRHMCSAHDLDAQSWRRSLQDAGGTTALPARRTAEATVTGSRWDPTRPAVGRCRRAARDTSVGRGPVGRLDATARPASCHPLQTVGTICASKTRLGTRPSGRPRTRLLPRASVARCGPSWESAWSTLALTDRICGCSRNLRQNQNVEPSVLTVKSFWRRLLARRHCHGPCPASDGHAPPIPDRQS